MDTAHTPLPRRPRAAAGTALLSAAALGLGACSGSAESPSPSGEPAALTVTAAFYPLEYAVRQVGGGRVAVQALTSPGVEPHDLEISPAAVRQLGESDVVVYLEGFQPAVDQAVAQLSGVEVINVAELVDLLPYEEHAHEDDDAHEEEDDDHGGLDPHFWLDPALLADLGHDLATALGELDPEGAEQYRDNAKLLFSELTELDSSFASALATCERDVIVVSHEAFGYLAHAYGLEQIGLSGVSPDAEPSPARLREVREVVEHEGVDVIFFETLVSSAVSESFANDLGVATAVLDPVEGLVDAADDYRSVMERNRDALAAGLACTGA